MQGLRHLQNRKWGWEKRWETPNNEKHKNGRRREAVQCIRNNYACILVIIMD